MLTVKNPDKHYCSGRLEKAQHGVTVFYSWSILNSFRLLVKLDSLLSVLYRIFGRRLKTSVFLNLFGIPDVLIGWIPLSVLKGIKLIRKYDIDIIYVSSKPFSSALIGALLKKVTGKPLVVDMRDPTIAFPFYLGDDSLPFKFYVKATKCFETKILRRVDKLVFVSEMTEQAYLSAYPFLENKTTYIYNGFFSEFFLQENQKSFDSFTLVYVGNYYPHCQDSELLFQALRKIISQKRIPKGNIKFLYLGSDKKWVEEISWKYDLSEIVICPGRVSRQESINSLAKASVIFLRIVEDMISTKLYEGLATGIPLLSAISNREVLAIIEEYSPQSINSEPHNSDALADAIECLYCRWKQKEGYGLPNERYLKHFNKEALTNEFASELDTLISSKRFDY
ncbi:MAG: glycosyltransferase [Thermodesulfobacteriota bacterium]|nr:glycosyltransferase [Thermodesulfobacteriota bacterium]